MTIFKITDTDKIKQAFSEFLANKHIKIISATAEYINSNDYDISFVVEADSITVEHLSNIILSLLAITTHLTFSYTSSFIQIGDNRARLYFSA